MHPIFNAIISVAMTLTTLEMTNLVLQTVVLLLSITIAILGLIKAIKTHAKDVLPYEELKSKNHEK